LWERTGWDDPSRPGKGKAQARIAKAFAFLSYRPFPHEVGRADAKDNSAV